MDKDTLHLMRMQFQMQRMKWWFRYFFNNLSEKKNAGFDIICQ